MQDHTLQDHLKWRLYLLIAAFSFERLITHYKTEVRNGCNSQQSLI